MSSQDNITNMESRWRTSAVPEWLWSVLRSQNQLEGRTRRRYKFYRNFLRFKNLKILLQSQTIWLHFFFISKVYFQVNLHFSSTDSLMLFFFLEFPPAATKHTFPVHIYSFLHTNSCWQLCVRCTGRYLKTEQSFNSNLSFAYIVFAEIQ